MNKNIYKYFLKVFVEITQFVYKECKWDIRKYILKKAKVSCLLINIEYLRSIIYKKLFFSIFMIIFLK